MSFYPFRDKLAAGRCYPIQENKSKTIVDSAIWLFAEKGYTETSIKDIAESAGIKSSSIYYYFESKKHLLDHIIGLYANVSSNKVPFITEAYIEDNDPDTVLHQLFFKFDDDSAMLYKQIIKIFLQEQYRIDEVREFMKTQYIENTQKYIKFILDKMVEFGKIKPVDTDIYAELLHSINIKSTITSGHYLGDPNAERQDKWQQALDFVIGLIVNGVGG